MNKKNALLSSVLVFALSALYIQCINKPDVVKSINDLRKKAQAGLDSTITAMAAQRKFYDSLEHLIRIKKLKEATVIVDRLIANNPKEDYYHVLRGEIYDAGEQYDSALYEYNISMSIQTFPISLDVRAKTYIKMGEYDSAINDYRHAFEINYYYGLKLAELFEFKKQKDSALKYYKIYLENDPNSHYVQQKVLSLQ